MYKENIFQAQTVLCFHVSFSYMALKIGSIYNTSKAKRPYFLIKLQLARSIQR